MSRLEWGKNGERVYETGISKGILYISGVPIPWVGLVGVEETFGSDASDPYYIDGVRFLNSLTVGDSDATLRALTYPEEFAECEGSVDLAPGFSADGQPAKSFDLCYQTIVGNDTLKEEYGRKIHLWYNLTAATSSKENATNAESNSNSTFSWDLYGLPEKVAEYRPTAHVVVDSTRVNPLLLGNLEEMLYGSENSDPYLPSLLELVELSIITISDLGDGTWTAFGPEELIVDLGDETYEIESNGITDVTANDYYIESSD